MLSICWIALSMLPISSFFSATGSGSDRNIDRIGRRTNGSNIGGTDFLARAFTAAVVLAKQVPVIASISRCRIPELGVAEQTASNVPVPGSHDFERAHVIR